MLKTCTQKLFSLFFTYYPNMRLTASQYRPEVTFDKTKFKTFLNCNNTYQQFII